MPALIEALKDETTEVRLSAAKTLGIIGPPARAAVPELTGRLADPVETVRAAAKEALEKAQAGQGK